MTFFESLILLLLIATLLLQVSRRTAIPYPTMLAAAGVAVALVPGSPSIGLEGHTALALFLAPILLDAAFDFPLSTLRKLWRPLLALAVFAVIVTTGVVAWIGWAVAGLPVAAAIALGAIVAPPDAAAATSVLRSAALPRRTVEVLTGESLLNDASALLLYTAAVAVQVHGGIDGEVGLHLSLAVPGGILFGLACAWLFAFLLPYTRGSLGGNLFEFVGTYLVWIMAERLELSAVLAVVAMGMYIANAPQVMIGARNRVQSFAVWSVAVFLLNVLAFLLMGMQAREIVAAMPPARLGEAAQFALLVVVAVIATRMVWVLGYNRLAARFAGLRGNIDQRSFKQGVVVGWCGMRGLVSLATAFALPASFPQRDLIVLTAFAVVIATLVLQGLTLSPLIRLLGLGDGEDEQQELARARRALSDAALASMADDKGRLANEIRRQFEIDRAALNEGGGKELEQRRAIKLAAIAAQRRRLEALRHEDAIGDHSYLQLQEELDWHELVVLPVSGRTIEEG
jgi:CPA1 family monovalent cation:H+ antiporter